MNGRHKRIGLWSLAVPAAALLLCLASRTSRAASQTIDFESFPSGQAVADGVVLDVQYASFGVEFKYQRPKVPVIESPINAPVAHSGTFEAMGPDYSQEFSSSDFRITFRSTQSLVQLYGGSDCLNAQGSLTAFDVNGNIVAPVTGPLPLTNGHTSTLFTVATSSPQILSVSYRAFPPSGPSLFDGCDEAIDDLHFEGNPPPGSASPPTISLTAPSPGNGAYWSNQALVVSGVYSGTDLYPQIEIDLTNVTPAPNSTSGATLSFFILLTPQQTTGTNLPFSLTLFPAGQLPAGNYNVLATTKDSSGQQAQATVSFGNVPPTNGFTNLGPFLFGASAESCQMAFYQNGALGYRLNAAGLTLETEFVPTVIAQKWRTVNAPIFWPFKTLGCPTSAVINVTPSSPNNHFVNSPVDPPVNAPLAGTIAQEFERGRIYASTGRDAVYVPGILRSALFNLGFAASRSGQPLGGINLEVYEVGWPLADPTWFLDSADPIWVFQRFDQYNIGPVFQNTIEVRGRMPQLYVERIGGSPTELAQAQQIANPLSIPTASVDQTTPSVWQTFPCSKASTDQWVTSCDTSALGATHPAGQFSGAPYCANSPTSCDSSCNSSCQTVNFSNIFSLPEWVDTGLIDQQSFYHAIIRNLNEKGPDSGSSLANGDMPLNHENCNPSDLNEILGDAEDAGAVVVLGLSCLAEVFTFFLTDECDDGKSYTEGVFSGNCRSDWNLHTRPLPTAGDWQYQSNGNYEVLTPTIEPEFEVEFEAAYAKDYFKNFLPMPNDLVTIHGRHIVDCGHCPFKAEIHPPDLILDTRSNLSANDGFIELDTKITEAYLWGNGFLPFGVPLTVNVFAPPRPSPTARMNVLHGESTYFNQQNANYSFTTLSGQVAMTVTGLDGEVDGHFSIIPNSGEWYYPTISPAEVVDFYQLSWF